MIKQRSNTIVRIAAKTSVVLAVLCLALIAVMAIKADADPFQPGLDPLWNTATDHLAQHSW